MTSHHLSNRKNHIEQHPFMFHTSGTVERLLNHPPPPRKNLLTWWPTPWWRATTLNVPCKPPMSNKRAYNPIIADVYVNAELTSSKHTIGCQVSGCLFRRWDGHPQQSCRRLSRLSTLKCQSAIIIFTYTHKYNYTYIYIYIYAYTYIIINLQALELSFQDRNTSIV